MAWVKPVYSRPLDASGGTRQVVGYEVRYRDQLGRQRTKGGFRRKRDAEAFVLQVEISRQQGQLVPHSRGTTLLRQVAASWIASLDNRRRPRTVTGYGLLLDKHVLPAFGHWQIGRIGYADVDYFVRQLEKSGRRPGTVRNTYFVLKMVLDHAVREGRIASNPCNGVALPSAKSPKMLFLSADAVSTLADALDRRWAAGAPKGTERQGASPYGIFVRFAAYTGLRAGELVALRVSDLKFATRTVHVQRTVDLNSRGDAEGPPKSAAGNRVVGIPEGLWADLIDYLGARRDEPAAAVFLAPNGRRFSYGTFYSLHFKPAVRAALPEPFWGLRMHDLRHTYASLLVAKGAHPKEMAERLGHCSVQLTLDRYSHLLPERDKDLTNRLDVEYRRQTARKDVVQEPIPEPPGQSI